MSGDLAVANVDAPVVGALYFAFAFDISLTYSNEAASPNSPDTVP